MSLIRTMAVVVTSVLTRTTVAKPYGCGKQLLCKWADSHDTAGNCYFSDRFCYPSPSASDDCRICVDKSTCCEQDYCCMEHFWMPLINTAYISASVLALLGVIGCLCGVCYCMRPKPPDYAEDRPNFVTIPGYFDRSMVKTAARPTKSALWS